MNRTRIRFQVFLVSCVIATALAKPTAVFLGYQDSLGQYSFGYSAPGSARSEVRTLNGATRGTYSYVDGTGVIQTAQYVADGENGFRVIATNLPQAPLPVQDTPEVMAARTAHLQAVEMATRREVVAQTREQSPREGPWVRKIEASLDGRREQSEIKTSASNERERQEVSDDAMNVESRKDDDDDESLLAIASGSGVNKENEKANSQMIREVPTILFDCLFFFFLFFFDLMSRREISHRENTYIFLIQE